MTVNHNGAVLNFAEKYQAAIAKGFSDQQLRTQILWNSPSNNEINFDGAKHVKVPKLTIDGGRKDRTRNTITNAVGNYSNDYYTYELTFDRYWETLVDPLDVDETNMVTSIANVTNAFNVQQKLPEMDRYMMSQLYKETAKKNADGVHNDELTEANILPQFDAAMARMDENRVPSTGRILFVTPKTNTILKSAEAQNRQAVINGNGDIARNVYSLDSVNIVVIPSDLFQSDYDFTEGAKVIDDSLQMNMMLIWNGAQIAPQKYSFVGMDAPSAATSGNFHYYEQEYADVIVLDPKAAGIEIFVDKAASKKTKTTSSK
ncbi:capsid protein [Lactobacillus sp. S2-2]|uniref:capsid protein n=1 Tax=Lactobacillus sp. S2-2 TaxID=2692917 RepID=UPI001F2C29E7|nr:capsid protein [Lactobacillus sp. S2-2]MCF6515562.1 capsid protein [Lactobacillus sp. S2-2]